ncbi:MAG: VOC family protein [Chloroflexi bacterium]|nr:VOC family protein [Chloroflexota bacterium]
MAENTTNPSHWFEIPVNDLARASAFYAAVVGAELRPVHQGEYRMAWFAGDFGAQGSVGALIHGPGRSPGKSSAMVYLTVPDVDQALETVRQHGGSVVMPTTRGEFGAIAHFEDSERNVVVLFSFPA